MQITLTCLCSFVLCQYGTLPNGLMDVPSGEWRTVDPGSFGGLIAFGQHPVTGTLFASSDMSYSLLRSTDDGRTYHPCCPAGHPTTHLVLPHPRQAKKWYAVMNHPLKGYGLWVTDDDGETWSLPRRQKVFFPPKTFGVLVPGDKDTIIFGFDTTILISRDSGKTTEDWSQGLQGAQAGRAEYNHTLSPVICYAPKHDTVYMLCGEAVFARKLGDPAWRRLASMPGKVSPTCIDYDEAANVLRVGCSPQGLLAVDPVSGSVSVLDEQVTAITQIQTRSKEPGSVWIWRDLLGLFKSTDGGKTWEWLSRHHRTSTKDYSENTKRIYGYLGLGYGWCLVSPKDPKVIYLPDHTSFDGGKTFTSIQAAYLEKSRSWRGNGLTLITTYEAWFDPFHPNRTYVGFSDSGLMVSDDRGYSLRKIVELTSKTVGPLVWWKNHYAIHDWGGCFAFAADPESPTTFYYVISGRNLPTGGIFKTCDDGRTWTPIAPVESGLPNATMTDILIFRHEGYHKRKLYTIANYLRKKDASKFVSVEDVRASLKSGNFDVGGGVYVSTDSGMKWQCLADMTKFRNCLSLMSLKYCQSSPSVMYVSSSRAGKRPAGSYDYIPVRPGQYGGVWKSTDAGKNWTAVSGVDMANCVELACHPFDPATVYAACVDGRVATEAGEKVSEGGLFVSKDGGKSWKKTLDHQQFDAYLSGKSGNGIDSIAVNPELPNVLMAAMPAGGVFRSLDGGATWQRVDWDRFKRYQASYHTLSINPHDPAEFYLALFGNSFVAYRDPVVAGLLEKAAPETKKNLVINGNFDLRDSEGNASFWHVKNYTMSDGKPVITAGTAPGSYGKAIAVRSSPSKSNKEYPADTWIEQTISPYRLSLARGKKVRVSCEAYAEAGDLNIRPRLELIQTVDGYPELVAESQAALVTGKLIGKPKESKKTWVLFESLGDVSPKADSLKVLVWTSNADDLVGYIDNVKLEVVD